MISGDSFTLAHLSDPHLAYLQDIRYADLLNKRFFGFMKWRLQRSCEHHADVVANLIDDIKANQPDHIVITGDLTHLGLPAEIVKAKELLSELGAPFRITVIPGNHDAYVAGALNRCLTHWIDYIVSDQTEISEISPGESISTDALFPSLRVRGPVALIGVSTARPCSTFLAVGSVGQDQLQRLRKLLMETARQGLFRIVLLHHPPISGIVSWRKRLTDAKAFRTIVQQYGAELILHGHAHRRSHEQIKTPDGQAHVIGISSASAVAGDSKRRARYHLYHLSRVAGKLEARVTVRSYKSKEERFVTEKKIRFLW
jgi:3',5'-cyclic AMP phosphodiesterase CpdA